MEALIEWLKELPIQHRLYAQAGLLVIVLMLAWIANFDHRFRELHHIKEIIIITSCLIAIGAVTGNIQPLYLRRMGGEQILLDLHRQRQ